MRQSRHSLHKSTTNAFRRLQGVWRSRGYGKILWIEENRYTLFEETAISCLPCYWGTLEELATYYSELRVSRGGATFSALRATGVTRVHFRRLKQLPRTAADSREHDPLDPQYNFEVFWHTFAEQYALFDIKGVDWDALYRCYRPGISPSTDPEFLFATLTAMVRPLRDGHIRLQTPFSHYDAGAQPALYKRLQDELERSGDHRDVISYLGELREALHATIVESYLVGPVSHAGAHLVYWGKLSGNTGYLKIRAMAGQSGHVARPDSDLATTDIIMQTILAELGQLENWVVDLRGNGGGYDSVALRFASYLIDRKRLAFSKAARYGKGLTGRQAVSVTPAKAAFSGNLFILTSELTSSAAEILVLALLQRPRLTLIGEPTHGILSDTLERHLPNGWQLTLSNEIYRAFNGELYEDAGIPPHIHIPYLQRRAREENRDIMLDRILKQVRERQ